MRERTVPERAIPRKREVPQLSAGGAIRRSGLTGGCNRLWRPPYPEPMDIVGTLTLPARLTVAVTRAALGLGYLASPAGPILREGGYGERLGQIAGPGGLLERLDEILADERGLVSLGNTVADLTSPDRPLGKALAPGGIVDRMLADDGPLLPLLSDRGPFFRLLAPGGPIDRIAADNGPLYRFLAPKGPLDRLLSQEGAIEHILEPGGLIDQLLEENGILESLLQPGGTLEQLIALGDTIQKLIPTLEGLVPLIGSLDETVPDLHDAVNVLNATVEPLSRVANRVPLGRRRAALAAGQPEAEDVESQQA